MTKQKENEAIAIWVGLECWCSYPPKGGRFCVDGSTRVWEKGNSTRYWGNCPRHSNNSNPPDYDRDEVAISLLPVLTKKSGNSYQLEVYQDGSARCYHPDQHKSVMVLQSTIAAAIKAAVLQLKKE
jgi:hypothetical protein